MLASLAILGSCLQALSGTGITSHPSRVLRLPQLVPMAAPILRPPQWVPERWVILAGWSRPSETSMVRSLLDIKSETPADSKTAILVRSK
jgi:hypothetical protein